MAVPGNGCNGGIAGAATKIGQSLITALPPSFILLLALNVLLLWIVLHFIDDQLDVRMKVLSDIVERCMARP